ncbi:thiamin pyrophosphokinase [Staphylococcus petrasii]|uniref:Thiamine diphosphokinase n=1 Tax=Staphylococcus petrasii TaxID=1276936 RepID=A0A380G1R7_9STAP|nr:thiamine diphosphokinase [Staphylococcus petrasii]PNZ30296.1 thiamine diphosphokinase [Staphylococcus petrasii]TGE12519.1 thiamine diphosphokinase [Staphylococcus petrasii]TGE18391.1 thiamine diphosphokinase [Staphylococcus petrasii]SUM44426.1 thiamin pyrophosphokinase [Staphylococcus petrasii]
MRINLLCGDRHLPQDIFNNAQDVHWGGIDRGTLILTNHQIIPKFTVGDFDSVTDEERNRLKETLDIHPVKAEKDDTDLALGVEEAVQRGYNEIYIFGATGGRLDHFMGMLQILLKPIYSDKQIKLVVVDQQNEIQLLNSGIHTIEKSAEYKYVSFIPVNGEVTLTLKGFKYNLQQQHLEIGSTLTISNEVEEPIAHINVENGQVLQMRSKDL